MNGRESKAPIGDGFWDRREGQSSWWERREGETRDEHDNRCSQAAFMAFDPDEPELILD